MPPTINLLSLETVGVDMKSNPLSLGNKSLAAATNLSFEEGVIRTRPSFRYHDLGIIGRFQGACLFTPSLGISATPFAQAVAGLVTVAGGRVFVNDTTWGDITCHPVEVALEGTISASSPVNVFGAENYLVIQCPSSNTHWWSGVGVATESPGMSGDYDWTDPVPRPTCFTPPALVANIPECDRFPCDPTIGCVLELVSQDVVNATTATFTLKNTGTTSATITEFTCDPPGGAVFLPPSLIIPAGTHREITVSVPDLDLTSVGISIDVANSCGGGTFTFEIPPQLPGVGCLLAIISVVPTSATIAEVTIQNIGSTQVTNIFVYPEGAPSWVYSPPPPWTLQPGELLQFTINGSGLPVSGSSFYVRGSCGDSTPPVVIPPLPAGCDLEVTVFPFDVEYAESGAFTVSNTGAGNVEVTDILGNTTGFIVTETLPFTLIPGESKFIVALTPGSQIIGTEVTIENNCEEEVFFLQNPPP